MLFTVRVKQSASGPVLKPSVLMAPETLLFVFVVARDALAGIAGGRDMVGHSGELASVGGDGGDASKTGDSLGGGRGRRRKRGRGDQKFRVGLADARKVHRLRVE